MAGSIAFHKSHGKAGHRDSGTATGAIGGLGIEGSVITEFQEKPKGEGGWINGGFFVLSPQS